MRKVTYAFLTLVGLVACSKQNEIAPAPTEESCSYQLDGRNTTGSSQAHLSARQLPDGTLEDWLVISLTSYPAGSTARAEVVSVQFHKPMGSSDASYQPLLLRLSDGNTGLIVEYTSTVRFAVSKEGNSYSGTFSGTSLATAGKASSVISQGVFTGAKL